MMGTCHEGRTALELSATNPDNCIVGRLPRTDAFGCVERALTVAVGYHNYEVMEKLASFPGVLLGGIKDFEPVLLTAASTGDVKNVQLLLVAGTRIKCTGHHQ
jgi:hypothetical protein